MFVVLLGSVLYKFSYDTCRLFNVLNVTCMGEGVGINRVFVGMPKGKRSLGRPRHMWEDNIKMDLREIWINGAN